ncbi:MAG: carbonic anhydrase [Thermoplasmatota archaeon]
MALGTFATVINCMDGRTQLPVINWALNEYGVDYVDSVTEPGPDGILANGPKELIDSIKKRVLISVEKHGSKNVAVVSHDLCAGNPVPREQHLKELRRSVELIRSWDLGVNVNGLWVGDDWTVHVVI